MIDAARNAQRFLTTPGSHEHQGVARRLRASGPLATAMIFVGIGANLTSPRWGEPYRTCLAAVAAMEEAGLDVRRCSRWYESAPVPLSDQPWYVNGVAEVATEAPAAALLATLHRIETDFGRVRSTLNAPRTLDLDLIAYHRLISGPADCPTIPHPRMHERLFVLLPLAELAPDWRHPGLRRTVGELIALVPPSHSIRARSEP